MEAYVYFDFANEDTKVFHMMGKPDETKHLVVAEEQAVISPSWSIHSGVGTSNYSFIWAMCGENITYTDMDMVPMDELNNKERRMKMDFSMDHFRLDGKIALVTRRSLWDWLYDRPIFGSSWCNDRL